MRAEIYKFKGFLPFFWPLEAQQILQNQRFWHISTKSDTYYFLPVCNCQKLLFLYFSLWLIFIFHENSLIMRISIGKVQEIGPKLAFLVHFIIFFMLKFDIQVKISQKP